MSLPRQLHNTTATYGCGWHQKRGLDVCGVSLRVRRQALEDRFLGAIRERVLDPELVLFIVERALERTAEIVAAHDPAADRRRLAEIEAELANLTRFAAKTGKIDEAAELYGEVNQERCALPARSAERPVIFDRDALAARVEARVRELRGGLEGAPERGRAILRALVGSRNWNRPSARGQRAVPLGGSGGMQWTMHPGSAYPFQWGA